MEKRGHHTNSRFRKRRFHPDLRPLELVWCPLFSALVLATSAACQSAPLGAPPPIPLASERKPLCRIVVSVTPTDGEQAAAGELQRYLSRMTRADIPITSAAEVGEGTRLLIGAAAAGKLGTEVSPLNLGPDGFILRSYGSDAIAIAGANDGSTLFAVYAFLEHLGCRWYMPGESGEVVPSEREFACQPLDCTEVPDFYHRVLWNNGWVAPTLTAQSQADWADWCRKNRLGGLPADHGHAYFRLVPEETYFAEHPEYFSLVRYPDGTEKRERGRQLCTSNPEVIEIVARAANAYFAANPTSLSFSLSPNDTGGFCECDACRALDGPGPNGLSDRILTFVTAVAERTDREHPGKLLAYYALYGNLPGPPTKVKPRDNVMPVIVNSACHLHAIDDPGCPRNERWREDAARWRRISQQLFAYDYFQYSDLPTPIIDLIGPNIRFHRDTGCLGFSGEILGRSPVNDVALYLAARMLWDADQDPAAILDEFYHLYYRSAEEPMRDYLGALEAAARRNRDHTVGASWEMYTPELLAELRGHLDGAAEEARGSLVKERVERAALDLQATTLFVQAARTQAASLAAPSDETDRATKEAIAAAEEFLNSIADRDIVAETVLLNRLAEMRNGQPAGGASSPSVSATTQPGYDDASTFGDLWDAYEDLGSLPTEGWLFRTDPRDGGEASGWHQPGFNDSRWQLIRIADWWEPQLGAYDGVAWYRRSIDLPAGATCLWFGAVDESAWVYLDGKLIGAHDEGESGWDRRFRIDLPREVGLGRHVLAVKVLDRALKGGIWKSVKMARPKPSP